MENGGRGLLRAAVPLGAGLLIFACLLPLRVDAGGRMLWLGVAYQQATAFIFELGLDHAMARWDAGLAHEISLGQPRKERASLAAGVDAFLRAQFRQSQDALGAAIGCSDEAVARRATRLADLAGIWAQTIEPLKRIETGDDLFSLRVPEGQEEWARAALPHIHQWVAGYRSLHPTLALEPVHVTFLSSVDQLSALMQVETRLLEKSGTVASTMFGHVLLLSPSAFPNGYYWPRALCHEMMHWLMHRLFLSPLPLVLEEGVATWLEEWGFMGRQRLLSLQDRALLALAPSGLGNEMDQANQPFFQADSAASARFRFLLAWWRVRSEAADATPQAFLARLQESPLPRATIRPSDLTELLAYAKDPDLSGKQPLPREAASAVAYALYPELLPERYSKTLEETRKRIYLGDLMWGRNHRTAALRFYLTLPEPAILTPEVFWRILKLRHEIGPGAAEYSHAEEVLALFPEDPMVLFGAVEWANQASLTLPAQELRFQAWLTNPFARETQGMVKKERVSEPPREIRHGPDG